MKFSIAFASLAAALLLASAPAVAQNTGILGFVKYDYDRGDGSPWRSAHRALIGAQYKLPQNFGSIDGAGAVSELYYNGKVESSGGVEVGYSNGIQAGPVALTGRVGYQYLSQADTFRASIEGGVPFNQVVKGFLGYEYLDLSINDKDYSLNRYIIGTDIALDTRTAVRVGLAYIDGEGRSSTGLTTAINYRF